MSTRILTICMLSMIVLLVLFNENTGTGHLERDPSGLIGTMLPPLTVMTLSGDEVLFSGLQRRNRLLIFFSTTCEHCRKELRFWNNNRMELSRLLDILCISLNTAEETEEFLSELSIELQVFTAVHHEVRERFLINSVPSLFVVDKEGIIQAYFAGSVKKQRIIEKLKYPIHEQSESRNKK